MKISSVIKHLEEILKNNGDIDYSLIDLQSMLHRNNEQANERDVVLFSIDRYNRINDGIENLLLNYSIEYLGLTARSENALKSKSIVTISDLTELDESSLLKIQNLGNKSLREIKKELARHGFSLKN